MHQSAALCGKGLRKWLFITAFFSFPSIFFAPSSSSCSLKGFNVLLFQSFILAVIVPDEEVLIPWAKENNLPTTLKELCENEVIFRNSLIDDHIGAFLGM